MENKSEKVQISKALLNKIIAAIERYEEGIDGEWGSCRSAKQLIEDNCMPDLYKELIKLRSKS
jgi:hypothetical protein